MRTVHYALSAVLGISMLAGCGGGGGDSGGSGGGGGTASAVMITENSATAVGAHALENTQTTSAAESGNLLPTGVQVQAGGSSPGYAASVRALIKLIQPQPSVATGVTYSQEIPCNAGGTLVYSGNISGASGGLVAGDSITMTANNCQMSVDGTGVTMNGSYTMTVVSGSIGSTLPFHVVLATSASNFSVSADGETEVFNGDMRLDWTATTGSAETLVATGSSFTNRMTVGSTSFTSTWKVYTQTLTYDDTNSIITGSLSAMVETNSTKLGSSSVSYQISTPTPLVWNSDTGAITAGQIRVVGASNSALLLAVTGPDTFSLAIDADGNGAYEKTVTVTATQLEAAL